MTSHFNSGRWVILEIDVDGTEAVVQQYPNAITLFLMPPSSEELERRLTGRRTETQDVIDRRLQVAQREIAKADRYQYQVINDEVDRAAREICGILTQKGDQ